MNKIVTLILVLMLGGASYAQAAAAMDCGMAEASSSTQSQLTGQSASCCDCSLKADNTLFDKISDFSKISVPSEGLASQAIFKGAIHSDPGWALFVQRSPPKPEHLFALYSVYRL